MTTGRINQVCNASQLYRNDTAAHRKPGVIKHQPANCNNTSPERRHATAKAINALSSCTPFKANMHSPGMALALNETQPALVHSHASPWSHGNLHTKNPRARPMGLGGPKKRSASPEILRTSTKFGRRPPTHPQHYHHTGLLSHSSLGGGALYSPGHGPKLRQLIFGTGHFCACPLHGCRGCQGAAETFAAPLPLPPPSRALALPLPFPSPALALPIPALSSPYPCPPLLKSWVPPYLTVKGTLALTISLAPSLP